MHIFYHNHLKLLKYIVLNFLEFTSVCKFSVKITKKQEVSAFLGLNLVFFIVRGQIRLHEVSTKLTTMNTPFRRYKFLKLFFGTHSAQEVFHRIINGNFIEVNGVETDIDDFLVWGKNTEDHNRSLITSLERAKKIGLTMDLDKCKFNADELVYLGHKISAKGIEPHDAKVKGIMELPEPTNKKAVQGILGLINYVAKFIPKLFEVTSPLRELLQKDVHWYWEEHHKNHLRMSKSCYFQIDV